MALLPFPPRARPAVAALALALQACGAPDAPQPPARATAASPVPTRDTVVRGTPAPPILPRVDTTDYLRATDDADPDSVLAGRVVPVVVVDAVQLGTRRGARSTALLVRLGPERHRDNGWYRVYVVQSTDSSRTVTSTTLTALGALPPGEPGFGAVDLDGDGMGEPYVAYWGGGRGGFEVTVARLGPGAPFPDEYMLFSAWTYLDSRKGDFSGNAPRSARVRRWLEAHARRVADVADPHARDTLYLRHHAVERQFQRDHGPGFLTGPVRIRWNAGPVPFAEWAGCRTRDGDLQWLWDESVWGYDPVRGRHFMLHDFAYYAAPNGLVPGTRYVWLGLMAQGPEGRGFVAYDRRNQRMVVVPVANLDRATNVRCGGHACGGPMLSVRNGRLYGDTVALVLPDSIVPSAEFADTGRICPRPAQDSANPRP